MRGFMIGHQLKITTPFYMIYMFYTVKETTN